MKVILIWGMKRKKDTRSKSDYSIYSERFKREVDEAHRNFFKKRGMNPKQMDSNFLFGSKQFRKFREDNPSSSLY